MTDLCVQHEMEHSPTSATINTGVKALAPETIPYQKLPIPNSNILHIPVYFTNPITQPMESNTATSGEAEEIRTKMISCTGDWSLICCVYLSLEHFFWASIKAEKANMERAKEKAKQTETYFDLYQAQATIQRRIDEFLPETRTFQERGFKYHTEMLAYQTRLAVLEGRAPLAPA